MSTPVKPRKHPVLLWPQEYELLLAGAATQGEATALAAYIRQAALEKATRDLAKAAHMKNTILPALGIGTHSA